MPARTDLHGPSRRRHLAWLGLLLSAPACSPIARTSRAQALRIQSVADWGGEPAPLPGVAQTITRLTIHHQGERWNAGDDVPSYLRRLQTWSRRTKAWVDIPYHYVVAPDGAVYAARPVAIAGDTNTDYDPQGHLLVMLLGNFEEQQPTSQQWQSTVVLAAQVLDHFGLATSAMGAHRDHSGQTVCPGANLMKRFEELRAAVVVQRR
jgi:N-acetylmuramoyl-L-alanine amidase